MAESGIGSKSGRKSPNQRKTNVAKQKGNVKTGMAIGSRATFMAPKITHDSTPHMSDRMMLLQLSR